MSTVSHALNGTAPISDEVRARVLEAANELGYLAKRKAKGTIATLRSVVLLVPEDRMPEGERDVFTQEVLRALVAECNLRGVKTVQGLLQLGQNPFGVANHVSDASADGVILLNDDGSALLGSLRATGVPTVLVNGEDPEMSIDSVSPANRFGARKAVGWLIGMGHRRIVHLSWPGHRIASRRRDGFMDGMREHGLESEARLIMSEGVEPEQGRRALANWLSRHAGLDSATAIFCGTDRLALGAMQALDEFGLRVPQDVSVLGFDGILQNAPQAASLATMAVPIPQLAREALQLLEQSAQRNDRDDAIHRLELGCRLIQRASVAAPQRSG